MGIDYQSVPIGAVQSLAAEQRQLYLEKAVALPRKIVEMLISPRTGAYIRGLVRSFDVPVEKAPEVALLVLEVATGDKTLQGLSQELQQKFSLPEREAMTMAKDIETELFRPVLAELGQAERQAEQEDDLGLGMPNTLNLRKDKSE